MPHSNLRKQHGIRTNSEVNMQRLAKDTANHYKKQLIRNTLDPEKVLIKHQFHNMAIVLSILLYKVLTRKS